MPHAVPHAETDHRSVRSIFKLCIVPTQCKCPKIIRSKFNMARLRHPYHYNKTWETLEKGSRPVHPMLKTALRSGSSLRRLSLKQQTMSWVLRNENIRIGSMRMMNTSYSCYMRRTRPMKSGKIVLAPNPRQTNQNISEDKPRWDCMRWKSICGTEREIKCKSTNTQTTPNSSSEL